MECTKRVPGELDVHKDKWGEEDDSGVLYLCGMLITSSVFSNEVSCSLSVIGTTITPKKQHVRRSHPGRSATASFRASERRADPSR